MLDVLVFMLVDLSFKLVARGVWGARIEDSVSLRSMIGTFTLIFAVAYVTVLHAATGQTIGKMLLRVHVVLVEGEPVPVGTSLLRVFGHVVSWFTLGLGYLMAGLRRDKRAGY